MHKKGVNANTTHEVIKMTLTQKEQSLLKDMKDAEKLCIEKYRKASDSACDPQLKNLFGDLSNAEKQHLQIFEKMEQGTVEQPQSGGSQPTFNAVYGGGNTPEKQNDAFLCTDLLSAEKHASHLYDTCVFEFTDENARKAINAIQAQEQNHGKSIYDYMKVNNMYN